MNGVLRFALVHERSIGLVLSLVALALLVVPVGETGIVIGFGSLIAIGIGYIVLTTTRRDLRQP